MDSSRRALVRASFAQIAPDAEHVAELFYRLLFEIDPSLRPLFRGDMKEQGKKLIAVLAIAVAHLDRIGDIVPRLRQLGRDHVGYGVKSADYDAVATALLATLETALGERFTAEARAAWTACYLALTAEMKAGAAEAEDGLGAGRAA